MSPEYGATAAIFPVDDETLRYLRLTGRPAELVDLVERYSKEQGLFRTDDTPIPQFDNLLELDLATIKPSLAGPRRPQDRVTLREVKGNSSPPSRIASPTARKTADPLAVGEFESEGGQAALTTDTPSPRCGRRGDGGWAERPMTDGAVVIAAITSCTNTSNPSVMLAAGLLAKKAVERGLTTHPYVKTSLAPGSRAVTDYLHDGRAD